MAAEGRARSFQLGLQRMSPDQDRTFCKSIFLVGMGAIPWGNSGATPSLELEVTPEGTGIGSVTQNSSKQSMYLSP